MNKKEFLNTLATKLSVLDKEEKQDIITEYTDTINEKVKQGQTEEEAVKDFGDIDDLVKEILKAYKINPDYEEKIENSEQKSEGLIKQGTGAISNFSKKIASHFNITSKDISLELIFEIIIRIFIVLLGAIILKGIFSFFSDLSESLFGNIYDPIGNFFGMFWDLLLLGIYLLICALMVIAVFKKYIKTEDKEINPPTPKTSKENINKKQINKPKEKNGITLGEICLLIVKIIVIIYVIIPFIIIDCLIIFSLIVSIIYLIKGINLIGLVLLLGAATLLFTYIIILIFSLLFGKGKASIIPVIISIVIMIIGGIMFIDMIMNIEYINHIPEKQDIARETKVFNTTKNVYIPSHSYYLADVEKIEDESMPDGMFKVDIQYNKEKRKIKIEENQNYVMDDCEYNYEEEYYDYEDEYENYQKCTQKTYHYINIYDDNDHSGFNEFKENYNRIINDLKDNKIYNYSKMNETKITITANSKTLNMIKTD